jgi:hypothetical protein
VTVPRSLPNRHPTIEQLIALANRAGRRVLSSAEISTLRRGIDALAAAATGEPIRGAPHKPSPQLVEAQLLLAAAVRAYAGAYGMTEEQALAEIRTEARL